MNRTALPYAGRLERLFANLLDSILLILPSALLVTLLSHDGLATLLSFMISIGYYTYFTASRWQATPGKRVLGIHVVRLDGRPLTARDALERVLAYSIPSLPMYASFISPQLVPLMVFWLSLLWFTPILFTHERIGYHDRLCKTRVVTGKLV